MITAGKMIEMQKAMHVKGYTELIAKVDLALNYASQCKDNNRTTSVDTNGYHSFVVSVVLGELINHGYNAIISGSEKDLFISW